MNWAKLLVALLAHELPENKQQYTIAQSAQTAIAAAQMEINRNVDQWNIFFHIMFFLCQYK